MVHESVQRAVSPQQLSIPPRNGIRAIGHLKRGAKFRLLGTGPERIAKDGRGVVNERNWSGTHRFAASGIHRPRTIDDLRRLVAKAEKIHAVGARHSFNGVADSPGALVDLAGLPPRCEIDAARRTVTVDAGARYGRVAAELQARGWALHNMASLPQVTVIGAVATGTHGSGDGNGTLSSAVAGLEVVTAAGDLVTMRRGDAGFDGMVVGLGAFGIVTAVTLDIRPSFLVRQDAFAGLPWSAALTDLGRIMAAAYSVSIMTKWSGPTLGRLWLKTLVVDGMPEAVSYPGAHPAPTVGERADEAVFRRTVFGTVGPWSERLPHCIPDEEPGHPDQIQSEYMLPRGQAMKALALLRDMGTRIDPHLRVTEIRSMAADALWLSPAYGHDAVALHFTWLKEPEPVAKLTAEIEEMLLPLGARPHWGKLMHASAAQLAPLYPRLAAFRELSTAWDPAGKFRNDFLDRHVFG